MRKFVSCNPGKYFQEGTPYEIGDTAIVRDYRVSSEVKLIKGVIIQKVSDVTYIVQTCSEGIHWKCHRDQIQHSLELDKYVPRSTNQEVVNPILTAGTSGDTVNGSPQDPQGDIPVTETPVSQSSPELSPTVK